MSIDTKTIEALVAAGIRFVADIPVPGGSDTVALKPNEIAAFINDSADWFSRRHGASKEQYLDWVLTEGEPRCSSTTLKGGRCKNGVSGGVQRSLEVWLQEDGGLCQVHGGLTSDEARRR